MPPRTAVEIVGQVAQALDAAHDAGLIHRDVKPSNVLVLPNGFAYLIDFGLARGTGQTQLTSTGMAVGTWAYMAPERYAGDAGIGSDVYALACLLFECLTGRSPFGDRDVAQQMVAHLTAPPPAAAGLNPAVPPALDTVIARGMAKEPDQRHSRAGEFAAAARSAPTPSAASLPTVVPAAPIRPPGMAYNPVPAPYRIPPPGSNPSLPPSNPQRVPSNPSPHPSSPMPRPGYSPLAFAPAHKETARPQVGALRVLWWLVLAVSGSFLGLLAVVAIVQSALDRETAIPVLIIANLVIDAPLVGIAYLIRREFKKFVR